MTHDREKLLERFKKSKKVVSTFVDQFFAKHGKKPGKEELANAPEYVRVCIKNCKKIKFYLEQQDLKETEIESSQQQQEIVVKNEKENSMKKPALNKSKSKVWGAHLNRSMSDITNNSTDKKRQTNLVKTTSYSGTLSAAILEDLSKSTRKNPKKRNDTPGKKVIFF